MPSPRIPYRPANCLPSGIPPLNLFRMWAHSPSTLPHALSLGTACFRDTSISPHHRELACLLNAQRLKCEYQVVQHVQIARSIAIPEEKIMALTAGNVTGTMWTEEEKALLRFVDEVIAGPTVSDGVFGEARQWFGDQALVELVTMLGFYYSLARVATVFGVELEHTTKESLGESLNAQKR